MEKKVAFSVNQSPSIAIDFEEFFETQSSMLVLHNHRATTRGTDRTKLRLSGESLLMLRLLVLLNLVRITKHWRKK